MINDVAENNVPWVGAVPKHWKQCRIKHVLQDFGSGGTPDTSILANWADEASGTAWVAIGDMSQVDEITETQKFVTPLAMETKGLRIWPIGTLLFSMYASLGHTATLCVPATINQAIMAFIPGPECRLQFLVWWLRHLQAFLGEGASTNTQDNLNAQKVLNLPCMLPPLYEQDAIVAFLARETLKLDELADEQGRLLSLLSEQRHAIISRAVTQGLDDAVPMKESGFEWLGRVSSAWTVQRLKHFVGGTTVGVVVKPSQYYADEGVPALRSLNVREMKVSLDNVVLFDPVQEAGLQKSRLHEGDVVAVRTGKPGTAAPIEADMEGVNCVDLIIIRRSAKFNARFLAYALNSEVCRIQYALGSEGAIQQHFNIETAANLVLALPSLDEQLSIVEHLDQAVGKLDELAEEARRSMALMREHRAALISAAVTGKIDVRGFAAPAAKTERAAA